MKCNLQFRGRGREPVCGWLVEPVRLILEPIWVAATAAKSIAKAMNEQPNKVLLVDDDPAMRRLISKWLESGGYRVRTAENGREAIVAIEKERPQILLTDWEMPLVDGLALCRWVREQQ